MWDRGWREAAWERLAGPWDVIVIGGGITGAGVLREAARAGLRALLLEAHDFAAGTSSRSAKMVHGGLRYLKNAQIRLTLESVSERERLLREGRGLVNPVGYLMVSCQNDRTPMWVFGAGMVLYDMLALRWGHRHYTPQGLLDLCPPLAESPLVGGYRYLDGQADDARLVLRVLREAVRAGALALNHAPVTGLLRRAAGPVCGVVVEDRAGEGRTLEIEAPVVISAAGAWADGLRAQVGARPRLRRLRGSHLVISARRLPLNRSVCLLHPADGRPVYAFPWDGVVVAGTTDVDHGPETEIDPAIQPFEVEYILAFLSHAFPTLGLSRADVQATFSGIRPVVDTGKADPSRESREHVLWQEDGLLTVTGGKLTTFRRMAHDALRAVRGRLPGRPRFDARGRALDPAPALTAWRQPLDPAQRLRLVGRHGLDAARLVEAAQPGELEPLAAGLPVLWAELRWGARAEGTVHLDDLLLRRTRLGLLAEQGGLPWLVRIRSVVQSELGWDDRRWDQEAAEYARLWRRCYSLPQEQDGAPEAGDSNAPHVTR